MKFTVEINNIDDLIEKLQPWAGAKECVDQAIAKNKADELYEWVEMKFGDTVPSSTKLNDAIWFDARNDPELNLFGDYDQEETETESENETEAENETSDDDFTYDDLPDDMKEPLDESVVRGKDVNDEEKPFYGVVGIKEDGTAVAIGVFTSVDDATDAGTDFTDNNEDAVTFDLFGADSEQECEDEFTFRLFNK